MGSTTTKTTIANRALQLLGYQPISSVTENSRGAKAVNRAYDSVLMSELRARAWGFSIVRAQLAASTTTPAFGKNYYYLLPGDYVMLAPPDQYCDYAAGPQPLTYVGLQGTDWQIENDGTGKICIVTDQNSPINVRYVTTNVTEAMFDYNFSEALAASLAMSICEEVTNSNTKLNNIEKIYDDFIELAAKRNAFEKPPMQSRVDPWIMARF